MKWVPVTPPVFNEGEGANCGTGSGGFKPGNKCAKGGGDSVDAADIPSSWEGDVEFYDGATGEVYATMAADEARQAVKDTLAMGDRMEGTKVRLSSEATRDAEKVRKEAVLQELDRRGAEGARQAAVKAGPIRPGHPDYVEPPERLYHATYAAGKIRSEGFKSSDELGTQTLGGSTGHLVSFTTKANAESYRQGLEAARSAARDEMSSQEMLSTAVKFGVSRSDAQRILDRSTSSFDFFQKVSLEGRQFPLFMGTSWPASLKTAAVPELVSVASKDLGDLTYNPSEKEWRAGKFKGAAVR